MGWLVVENVNVEGGAHDDTRCFSSNETFVAASMYIVIVSTATIETLRNY